MNEDYEAGYRDGMNHVSQQVEHVNAQMVKMAELLNKALFVQPISSKPKPGMNIWLIMDGGIVTTGYFVNNEYIADSGMVVSPEFWCFIPPIVNGVQIDVENARRLRKE